MDGTRPREPLTDSALDRELESALGVEPSPEFLARVRTRLAVEPEVSSWRLAVRGWAVEPLWGVAVVGIVLAIVVPQLMRDDPVRPRPDTVQTVRLPIFAEAIAGKKPDTTATPVEADRQVGLAEARRDISSREMVPQTTPLRLSQPLFSEDERRALVLLVTAVEEGRVPPLPASTQAGEPSPERLELYIAPLVIDPLPQLARVRAEGEDQW